VFFSGIDIVYYNNYHNVNQTAAIDAIQKELKPYFQNLDWPDFAGYSQYPPGLKNLTNVRNY